MRYKAFLKDCKTIEKYYDYLITLTNKHNFVGSTNEWIIDNYYMIAEIKSGIRKQIKENKKFKYIINNSTKLYMILSSICEENNFNLNYNLLINRLKSEQKENKIYLSYKLIEVIPIILSFIFIERLAILCVDKKKKQDEKQKIRDLVKEFDKKLKNNEEIILKDYIKIDKSIVDSPEIVEQLNDNLKEFGMASNELFIQLNEMLQECNLDLKELINMEHNESIGNNILIANIFNSLRLVLKLKVTDLFDKLSRTEEILKQDKYYKKMTSETKNLYRSIISKNSKGVKEFEYASRILEKSIVNDRHIGFYLLKKPNYSLRSKLYVTSIIGLTIILSGILSVFTLDYWWLSFLLLLVPLSELIIQLLNKVLLKFNTCQPLPKIDFSKGIDENNATMVVIPTIIKDVGKINKMFELLEKYYLANKSDNLYFSLLGDCAESNTITTKTDNEIADYGISLANKLNEKYKTKIFSFMYRKRVFNEGENKFLGYERKRGALIHFNKLLLGKLSSLEKEKYIYVENVTEVSKKIKYVITVDTDTELVLNTALSLVGVMAHPLNKPVLNKKKK